MSLPTIDEYKIALQEMNDMVDSEIAMLPNSSTFRTAMSGIEQAILFQDAWGAELADVQVLLNEIRNYFNVLWRCTPETFEMERLKISQWYERLNQQLTKIEKIEYSP